MKIKLTYLTILAAAVFATASLSSCSWFDNDGTGDGEEHQFKTGYLSFRLDLGKKAKGTRAGGEETGAEHELHIGQVYLLLYNVDGNLKYAWDLIASNIGAGEDLVNFAGDDVLTDKNPLPGSFTTLAREISSEPYYLVVIANPGSSADPDIFNRNPTLSNLDLVIGTSAELASSMYRNLTALQAAMSRDRADLGADYDGTAASGDKFFMSNANGPVPVSSTSLKATKAAAEDDPVSLNMERALAKILVNAGATVPVTDGITADVIGEVTEFKWILQNMNDDTYLIRQYGNIAEHYPDFQYASKPETYSNGLLVGKEYLYAKDPNMGVTGSFTSEERYPADIAGDNGRSWNIYADPMKEDSFAYTTENTMSQASQTSGQLYDFMTHVWARVKLRIYDFGTVNGFWSINNGTPAAPQWVMCTWAQAKEWWTSGEFPANMTVLKTFLQETESQWGGADLLKVIDLTAAVEPELEAGDASFVPAHYAPQRIESPGTGIVLYYHREGICNYRIPVKHFCLDGEDEDNYGYYGAVRNNVYKITVNGVHGPGSPASADQAYISADVTIRPWYKKGQYGPIDPYDPEP